MKKIRRIRKVKKGAQVILPGRTDWDDFLKLTDVLTERRPHHHFLAFVVEGARVTIHAVDAARKLSDFPRETQVMVQWPGTWRSDWFKTTVGELLDAREAQREEEQA